MELALHYMCGGARLRLPVRTILTVRTDRGSEHNSVCVLVTLDAHRMLLKRSLNVAPIVSVFCLWSTAGDLARPYHMPSGPRLRARVYI